MDNMKQILEYMISKRDGVMIIKNTQIDMEVTIASPEDKGELYDILVKGKKITQFYKDRAYINHRNPLIDRVTKLFNSKRYIVK